MSKKSDNRRVDFDAFMSRVRTTRQAIYGATLGSGGIFDGGGPARRLIHQLRKRGVSYNVVVDHDDNDKFWHKVYAQPGVTGVKIRPVHAHTLAPKLHAHQAKGYFNPITGALNFSAVQAEPSPEQTQADELLSPKLHTLATLSAQEIIDIINERLDLIPRLEAELTDVITELDAARRAITSWKDEATRLSQRVDQLGAQLGNADLENNNLRKEVESLRDQLAEANSRPAATGGLRIFRR